jgi:hypothetical protein
VPEKLRHCASGHHRTNPGRMACRTWQRRLAKFHSSTAQVCAAGQVRPGVDRNVVCGQRERLDRVCLDLVHGRDGHGLRAIRACRRRGRIPQSGKPLILDKRGGARCRHARASDRPATLTPCSYSSSRSIVSLVNAARFACTRGAGVWLRVRWRCLPNGRSDCLPGRTGSELTARVCGKTQ